MIRGSYGAGWVGWGGGMGGRNETGGRSRGMDVLEKAIYASLYAIGHIFKILFSLLCSSFL